MMSGKDFLKQLITSFFVVVTLVSIAIAILGCVFRPEQRFGYEAFFAPVLYGLLSMIPVAIMYSKKELTVKQLYIRKVLQLFSIEVILYLGGYGIENIKTASKSQTVAFGISIVIVYVLADVISGIINANDAKKLTKMLQQYQK
ncbi:MAG: hypothetical protein PUB19_01865 [Lachnospiraceae bacterium]|nr:hypothetical protein [Lachnospiraceae bacterium]